MGSLVYRGNKQTKSGQERLHSYCIKFESTAEANKFSEAISAMKIPITRILENQTKKSDAIKDELKKQSIANDEALKAQAADNQTKLKELNNKQQKDQDEIKQLNAKI